MNALSPNLLDTDFKQLVELARARLPQSAPGWTDHNLHDPGIMLIELLAWTTEAQIYAVARVRNDERWAFGSLFGLAARGPVAAQGMAWPGKDATGGALLVPAGAVIDTGLPQVPVFRLTHPINITAARLTGVETRLHDGRVLDHTAANGRAEGGFYPFGVASHPDDCLVLSFEGNLLAPNDSGGAARNAFLALGVRVEQNGRAEAAAAPHGRCMTATLLANHRRIALPVHADDTGGFTRSGVLLLSLREVPAELTHYAIELGADGFPAPPRILGIQHNVLPMEQAQRRTQVLAGGSTGLADQVIELVGTGICFPGAAPVVTVRYGDHTEYWHHRDELASAEPDAPVYHFDPDRGRILFGNGVNGRIPPEDAEVRVDYDLSEGADGNLAAGLRWTLRGGSGHFYDNLERTAGGAAALDLGQLRRLARARVRQAHAIVTASDLEDAARGLASLRVARVQSLNPALTKRSGLPADWLLVALRERPPPEALQGPTESRRWLERVRQALAPHILLGERLRVVAPDYVPLRIEATLVLRQGVDPAAVRLAASRMLAKYFSLLDAAGGPVWPLGRPVRALDVKGRLLLVEGVAGVRRCALVREGEADAKDVIELTPTGLPLFQSECSILAIASPGGRV